MNNRNKFKLLGLQSANELQSTDEILEQKAELLYGKINELLPGYPRGSVLWALQSHVETVYRKMLGDAAAADYLDLVKKLEEKHVALQLAKKANIPS